MKTSLKDGSSYLIIDHKDSPGIRPEDIPIELKNKVQPILGGTVYERDVQFCAHCGAQVILNPLRERPRSYCAKCDHYICDNPICNKTCEPVKKLFDQVEKEQLRCGDIVLTDNI